MFAFTSASTVPLFYAAGISVALASICSLICNHQVSSMFPQVRGLCISLISGAYDSSTVIAFIISLTYKSFPFKWSFIILAIFAVFVGIFVALFILTRYSRDMGKYAASSKKEEVDFSEVSDHSVPKSMHLRNTHARLKLIAYKRAVVKVDDVMRWKTVYLMDEVY
ncbi:unnamed protein product [Trichobilharzia regenti]|nr:unnamed protein product [Trichobilharzia regenti]